ncbi:hypothetical protein BB561_005517 [Smittium simulii]|uniref:Reverse transcriptase domain-containing protein n=1 Tax=Smittium simulii TaxID=133385 RepID=A0A2T9Y9Z5_9FUNG|nr:hypothetical protein BB561_005517 [Smittium simulii]
MTDAKLNVWEKKFGDLADDTTGNSRNNTKWDYIFSNKTMPYYEGNNIITWEKVTIVLEATQNSKVAGIDTIPIFVSVSKKGNLKDLNNYRGISLIPTLFKLVSKIAANKLSRIEQKYNILVKEQAGF